MKRLIRTCHLALALSLGLTPVFAMLLSAAAPAAFSLYPLYPALLFMLLSLCLLIRGKLRIAAGVLCASALFALSGRLFPPGTAFYAWIIPALGAAALLLSLPIGGWSPQRDLPFNLYAAGLFAYVAAHLGTVVSRRMEGAPLHTASGALTVCFIVFLLLFMLSLNRASMNDAAQGRQRAPLAMRRINALLTCGLLGVTLLISAIPAISRLIRRAWELLLRALLRLAAFLAGLMPAPASQGGSGGAGGFDGGLPPAAAQPGLLARILEALAVTAAVILMAVLAFMALRVLLRQLRRLLRRLLLRLTQYMAAAAESYEDEITDTRGDGARRSSLFPRLQNPFADERSLSPQARVRQRYRRLMLKHPEWADGATARETLPPGDASIYERARYSDHPVTKTESEEFLSGSRRQSSRRL